MCAFLNRSHLPESKHTSTTEKTRSLSKKSEKWGKCWTTPNRPETFLKVTKNGPVGVCSDVGAYSGIQLETTFTT